MRTSKNPDALFYVVLVIKCVLCMTYGILPFVKMKEANDTKYDKACQMKKPAGNPLPVKQLFPLRQGLLRDNKIVKFQNQRARVPFQRLRRIQSLPQKE